jgi:hypothetical protein
VEGRCSLVVAGERLGAEPARNKHSSGYESSKQSHAHALMLASAA